MNQFDFVGSSYFVQYFISSCACAGSILLYFLLLFDGLGKLLEHSEKLKKKKNPSYIASGPTTASHSIVIR